MSRYVRFLFVCIFTCLHLNLLRLITNTDAATFNFKKQKNSRGHRNLVGASSSSPHDDLRNIIASEKAKIAIKLGGIEIINKYVKLGSNFTALSKSLTDSYFGRREFVIGVTGGSSSQGWMLSWPYLIESYLKEELGLPVILKNAAQGSTSQYMSAPCINALVGDNLDLLFWEFGMNDEPLVYKHDKSYNDPNKNHFHFLVTESYVREAIMNAPRAMGFVHLWSIHIHEWENDQQDIPDQAYFPLLAILEHYKLVYNSYFAVNIIGYFASLNKDKREFLRDGHHPNDYGHQTISAITLYAILYCWEAGLESHFETILGNIDYFETDVSYATMYPLRLIQTPLITRDMGLNLENYTFPNQHTKGHCLMSLMPHYGIDSSIYHMACYNGDMDNCTRIDVGKLKVEVRGKVDKNRTDRKALFLVQPCESLNGTGGLYFGSNAIDPFYLLLDCGEGNYRCPHYKVFINGYEAIPDDSLSFLGYSWAFPFIGKDRVISLRKAGPNSSIFNNSLLKNVNSHQKFVGKINKSTKKFQPMSIRICGNPVKVYNYRDGDAGYQSAYNYDYELLARIVILESILA